ncbi:uncharacterized protein LOC125129161 [Phacochoerus africanus]|uniref:uncharacterized protein LOC125129161 n=1 Tax=Phacochoerus africanus TaxID=41426 RepID=UPI001FD94AD7|nr:uncharacterized protein LOC125129161 [Phacochoerus africanus]
MHMRIRTSRDYDSQNPPDRDSISQKAPRPPLRNCAQKRKLGSSVPEASCSHTKRVWAPKVSKRVLLLLWVSSDWCPSTHSQPRLFMLEEEECPPQSQFLGKRRAVEAQASKEERVSATAKGRLATAEFFQAARSHGFQPGAANERKGQGVALSGSFLPSYDISDSICNEALASARKASCGSSYHQ